MTLQPGLMLLLLLLLLLLNQRDSVTLRLLKRNRKALLLIQRQVNSIFNTGTQRHLNYSVVCGKQRNLIIAYNNQNFMRLDI